MAYSLIFVKCGEGNRSGKVDIAEFDFVKGRNVVPQKIADFVLENVDKVMLWKNTGKLLKLCGTFVIGH